MKLLWRPVRQINPASFPKDIRDFLLYTGSLTEHLEYYCRDDFNLELTCQSWQRPLIDEAKILHIQDSRYALIREIYLKCGNRRLVYGRSIIPAQTFTGAERRLAYWGKRSLGDYLFTQRKAKRGSIEITRIPENHKLINLASRNLPTGNKGGLWGRRSMFYIRNKPLLVVEIFLPDITKCKNI